MTPSPTLVHIHYRRPPRRLEIFTQLLLLDSPEVKVTLAKGISFDSPIRILGEVALEEGSDAVWFTFPDRWHDIGRFHRADGTFTGIYANILTPPVFTDHETWETTDLFLDVWLGRRDTLSVLDEEELEEAQRRGWVTPEQAARAREEVQWILRKRKEGVWPPRVVREWTRERALQRSSEAIQAPQRRPTSR